MPSRRRLLIVAAGLCVVAAFAVVALLYTPPVRSYLSVRLTHELRARANIGLTADRLDFNLFTLSVRLANVRLVALRVETAASRGMSPIGPATTPFLEADAVEVRFKPSILRGALGIGSVRLSRPRIRIVREADGTWNLPSPATVPAAKPPARLDIGQLVMDRGAISYRDLGPDVELEVPDLALNLSHAAGSVIGGSLNARGGARVRVGTRESRASLVEGFIGFDGTTVMCEPLTVEVPEGTLEARGSFGVFGESRSIEATYRATIDVGRAAAWSPAVGQVSGTLSVTGRIAGPLASPLVTAELKGGVAGGTIAGTARVGVASENSANTVSLEYADLDLQRLLAAARIAAPFVVDARLAGRALVSWTGARTDALRLRLENTAGAQRVRPGRPGVAGHLTFIVDQGAWTLQHAHALGGALDVSGVLTGRFTAGDAANSSLAGDLRVRARRLASALATLDASGIDMSAPVTAELDGDAQADLTLSGTLSAPRAIGAVRIAGFRTLTSSPSVMRARIDLDTTRLTTDEIEVSGPGGQLRGGVAVRFASRNIEGQFRGDFSDARAWLQIVPERARPLGSLAVEAGLAGTLTEPRFDLSVAGTSVELAGQHISRLDARARLAGRALFVDRAEFHQTGSAGRLSLAGHYDLDTRSYTVKATGADLQVEPIPSGANGARPLPIAASVALVEVEGKRSLDRPGVHGSLDLSRFAWDRFEIGPAKASVALADGTLRLTAGAPELALGAEADVAVEAPHRFTASAGVTGGELARWLRRGAADASPVTGRVSFTTEAAGSLDDLSSIDAEVVLDTIDVALGNGRVRLAEPARLRYAGGQLAASGVRFQSGSSTVTLGGLLAQDGASSMTLELDGDLSDASAFFALERSGAKGPQPLDKARGDPGGSREGRGATAPSGVPGAQAAAPNDAATRRLDLRGRVRAWATASGSVDRPAINAELVVDDGAGAVTNMPAVTSVGLRAALRDGMLDLAQVTGSWQGATLEASGRLPMVLFERWLPRAYAKSLPSSDRRAHVNARVTSLTEAAVAPWLARDLLAEIDAEAAATIMAETDDLALDHVRGDLTLDRFSLRLARSAFDQRRPTRVTLEGGRVSIADWAWGGAGNEVTVTGGLEIGGDRNLDVQVRAQSDLGLLGAFVPGVAAAGRADLHVRMRSAAREPDLAGAITIVGGELRVRDPRLAIADLDATATLANNHLIVRNATANANGGTLRIDGDLRLERFAPADGSISAEGRGIALHWPQGFRTELDVDLALSGSQTGPLLGGKVKVRSGAYREPVVLTAQLLDALSAPASGAPAGAAGGFAERLRFDIDVQTVDDVRIDNNYGEMQVGGDLDLVGTLARPGAMGRMTFREGGKLFLGGNVYRLQQSTIDFNNQVTIEPDVNITAHTRVAGYNITMAVRGKANPPNRPTVELTSDEADLTRFDLASLLVTGRRARDLGSAGKELQVQTLNYLSGDLLGIVGRRVGFDSVRLERGTTTSEVFGADPALLASDETDPGQRLSITRSLSRQVELLLSQNLREKGDLTWILMYHPWPSLELRGISRGDGSRTVEFSQQLDFGAGRRVPSPSRRRGRDGEPRVADVRLTGLAGQRERDARSRLSVEAGDRFDFSRWQDDRDALEAFVRNRGHFEARVRARREEVGEGAGRQVALEYAVTLGPQTLLTIGGARLPDGVVDELRKVWTDAGFDAFLLDDLRSKVLSHLASRGFLRAEIAAQMRLGTDQAAPVKEVELQVKPGPRAAIRTVEFIGDEHVSRSRLEGVLEEQKLGESAWHMPGEIQSALVDFYKSLGYLAASVTVGTPRIDGEAATLHVAVSEGPLFRVSGVRVEGARARSAGDVRMLFGVEDDAPYEASRIESGRRAVEAAYRRDGFNTATTRAAAAIDREAARVSLTLDVSEGPREVLADVAVDGARNTAAPLIARELGETARPGMPIDQEKWFQARKRLYDLGVFKSADVGFEPSGEPVTSGAIVTQPMRARVALEEWPPYRFRYGFRFGDEFGPLGEGRERALGVVSDIQRRNLLGRAITIGVAGRLQNDLWLGRTFATTPRTFGLPLGTSLFLTRSHETVNPEGAIPFVTGKTTVTVEQQVRALSSVRVSYGYRYERNHVFDPAADPADPFAINDRTSTARLTGAVVTERRDDPQDATRGWFQSSNLEYSSAVIGSDLQFVKYLLQASNFRSVGPVVVASNLRFGGVYAFGQDVILSEKLFAGGSNSVRGYGEDALGPVDAFGTPMGGNAMLVFNQEMRFPVYRWIRGVAFVDAGNVFPLISHLRLGELKVGVGLGARVNTPFGQFRVDFALPLPRLATGPRGRWYFSLGHVF